MEEILKIIFEGHFCNSHSIETEDNFYYKKVKEYQARILIDVKSEIFNTQIQFISNETKTDYWIKEDLMIAFNELHNHIKSYIESDYNFNFFGQNLFFPKFDKEIIDTELLNEFEIEIPENNKNIENINNDLLCIKEAHDNFKKCKDKLFDVISYSPSYINDYYGGINNLIYILSNITQAGVVTLPNSRDLDTIRSAFNELKKRKDTNNHTYKVTRDDAQRKIYGLDFPKFFKTKLPKFDVEKTLKELR